MIGSHADMSRAKRKGQVQKVTWVESPRCLATGKTGKTRTSPRGQSFLPSKSLVMRFGPSPDLSSPGVSPVMR